MCSRPRRAVGKNLAKARVHEEGPSTRRYSGVGRNFQTTHPVPPDKQDEKETTTWSVTFFEKHSVRINKGRAVSRDTDTSYGMGRSTSVGSDKPVALSCEPNTLDWQRGSGKWKRHIRSFILRFFPPQLFPSDFHSSCTDTLGSCHTWSLGLKATRGVDRKEIT